MKRVDMEKIGTPCGTFPFSTWMGFEGGRGGAEPTSSKTPRQEVKGGRGGSKLLSWKTRTALNNRAKKFTDVKKSGDSVRKNESARRGTTRGPLPASHRPRPYKKGRKLTCKGPTINLKCRGKKKTGTERTSFSVSAIRKGGEVKG